MKFFWVVLALPVLPGCVSIDLPGAVTDAAKVALDTYRSVAGHNGERGEQVASADSSNNVYNTYIGHDDQTPAEVKKLCVSEAVAKLFKANGKEVPYTVTETTISTVNNAMSANCRVVADRVDQIQPKSGKQ